MRILSFMAGWFFCCMPCFSEPKGLSAQEQKTQDVVNETLCRAAIDIGSGTTKLCIANVDKQTGRIQEVLLGEEFAIPVAHHLKEKNDGILGDKILAELRERVRIFRDIALEFGAEKLSGIATAAFRESKNGRAFISQISEELGVDLRVITQEEEGNIGFLTAVAASGKEEQDVIAWDSGGASFQIVYRDGEQLAVYKGPWGGARVMATLIQKVRGQEFVASMSANPMTIEEVKALCEIIKQNLPPASAGLQDKIKHVNREIVGIGGGTSIFDMAAIALNKQIFSKAEVWAAIESLVGKTDEELSTFPEKEYVLPKLASLYCAMDYFGIESIQSCRAIGSTLGMFMDKGYW